MFEHSTQREPRLIMTHRSSSPGSTASHRKELASSRTRPGPSTSIATASQLNPDLTARPMATERPSSEHLSSLGAAPGVKLGVTSAQRLDHTSDVEDGETEKSECTSAWKRVKEDPKNLSVQSNGSDNCVQRSLLPQQQQQQQLQQQHQNQHQQLQKQNHEQEPKLQQREDQHQQKTQLLQQSRNNHNYLHQPKQQQEELQQHQYQQKEHPHVYNSEGQNERSKPQVNGSRIQNHNSSSSNDVKTSAPVALTHINGSSLTTHKLTSVNGARMACADDTWEVPDQQAEYRTPRAAVPGAKQSDSDYYANSPAITSNTYSTTSIQHNITAAENEVSQKNSSSQNGILPVSPAVHDARPLKQNGFLHSAPNHSQTSQTNANNKKQLKYQQQHVQQHLQQQQQQQQKQELRNPFRYLQDSRFQSASPRSHVSASPTRQQTSVILRSGPRSWENNWTRSCMLTSSPSNTRVRARTRPHSSRTPSHTLFLSNSSYVDSSLRGFNPESTHSTSKTRTSHGSPTAHSYRLDPSMLSSNVLITADLQPRPKSILKNKMSLGTRDGYLAISQAYNDRGPGNTIVNKDWGLCVPASPGRETFTILPKRSPPFRRKGRSLMSTAPPSPSRRPASAGPAPGHAKDEPAGHTGSQRKSVTFNSKVKLHIGSEVSTFRYLSVDS